MATYERVDCIYKWVGPGKDEVNTQTAFHKSALHCCTEFLNISWQNFKQFWTVLHVTFYANRNMTMQLFCWSSFIGSLLVSTLFSRSYYWHLRHLIIMGSHQCIELNYWIDLMYRHIHYDLHLGVYWRFLDPVLSMLTDHFPYVHQHFGIAYQIIWDMQLTSILLRMILRLTCFASPYISFAISIPLGSVCVCVCMRVCLYECESSRPFIIYYRLCMLTPDSS